MLRVWMGFVGVLAVVSMVPCASAAIVELDARELERVQSGPLVEDNGLLTQGATKRDGGLGGVPEVKVAPNAGTATYDAGFHVLNLSLEGFSIKLRRNGVPVGEARGDAGPLSELALLAASMAGGDYDLVVRGVARDEPASYTIDIGIAPIPPAALLLAPAVAGMGFLAYRRRLP